MFDSIIIGAGPAGISASLYLARANKKVLVLYYGTSELEKAHNIDNYYGFEGGIKGKDLFEKGIKQAKRLNVLIKNEEVVDAKVDMDMNFTVRTTKDSYSSKTLIIATGNKRVKPDIENLALFEGKGVSYCAVCDAFFYRRKRLVVLGDGDYALSEAKELKNVTEDVSIVTNSLEKISFEGFNVVNKKVKSFLGENKINEIEFTDGSKMEVDGVFIALGTAGGIDLSKKLGIITDGNNIVTDNNKKTNIDGIYACGDAIGGLLQVSKAVCDGAIAGIDAIKYINEKR